MTTKQSEKLAAFIRVIDLQKNEDYATVTEGNPDFAYEHNRLVTTVDKIKNATMVQAAKKPDAEAVVHPQKLLLARVTYKYARRGYRLAKKLGLAELAKSLHFSMTYILEANKELAIDRAKAVKKVLDDNKVTPLTNITAPNVKEIADQVISYAAVKELPLEATQKKKIQGTDLLPDLFNEGVDAMNATYDVVDSYFGDSEGAIEKEMVAAYKLAKHYIPVGHRSQGILGNASHAELPCRNASIHIVDTDKYATTDYLGNYSLAHVETGFYTVTCKTEGGDELTLTVYIHAGVMEELNFIFA